MKPYLLGPLVACLALTSCAVTAPGASVPPGPAAGDGAGTTSCTYRADGEPSRPVDPPSGADVPASGTVTATLRLGGRDVVIELDRALAPCAVHSFESLARQGFHDGSTCHRLASRGLFILQCGDPTGTGRGGPGYVFADEVGPGTQYPRGVVAMANRGPDTNGSQFFLVFADTPLPAKYTVFGRMDDASTQVVADIAFQGHDNSYGDGSGRPHAPADIATVTLG